MTRSRIVVGGAALVAALAVSGEASASMSVVGAKAGPNATVSSLVGMADAFWQARGLSGACAPLRIVLADSMVDGDVDAWGFTWQGQDAPCEMVLDRALVARVQSHRRDRESAGELGELVFHERGHQYGLGHSAAGVMNADSALGENVPWAVRVWAKVRAGR